MSVKSLLTTRVENRPNRAKRRAAYVTQGQDVEIRLDLRDEQGIAIDPAAFYEDDSSSSSSSSSSITSSSTLETAVKDPSSQIRTASLEAAKFRLSKATPIMGTGRYDAATKSILFRIPNELMIVSQILTVEVAVFNKNGIAASEQIYVWIEPSVFYADARRGIFPALDEIKLQVRDSAPEDNHMMKSMEYDLAEICYAMVDALHTYNTARPPIPQYLFTDTFKMQADFMNGILAVLYQMSWEHRARNRIAYAAGGVTIDDHWNFELYLKMAQEAEMKYAAWVKKEKKSINMTLGWSHSGIMPCCG